MSNPLKIAPTAGTPDTTPHSGAEASRHGLSPALAILIGLLAWAIASQLVSAVSWGKASYELTEWLINYSGGFVRRGLPGTLIGIISEFTGIQANYIAISAGLTTYLLLMAWLLRHATGTFPTVLILSCIVMGIPAYQNSIVRKDCLGLLFLIGCLMVEQKCRTRFLRFLGVNLLAVTAILCHETFVFYALGGFILFRSSGQQALETKDIFFRSLRLLPAGACLILTAVYHGTAEQAVAINNSWMPLWQVLDPGNPALATPSATIAALGWTSREGLSLSIHMLTSGFYQPMAWAMVFTVSFILMVLFTARSQGHDSKKAMTTRIQVTAILLAQLLFISPLFLLGVDYGRWLFFWLASSMILCTFDRRAPLWLESSVARLFEIVRVPTVLGKLPARDWYLLFFGVPVCWNLYNFLVASPVMRHLEIIRSWF